MSIKVPRLIRDRCGVYYFRFLVPLEWRESVGKAEIRRSLRTKDAAIARHAALLLSARLEAMMVDRKFLTNPTLGDFAHLIGRAPNVRKQIRIDVDRGIVETDTPEEAIAAVAMVQDLVRVRATQAALAEIRVAQAAIAEMPSSRCGTTLEMAVADFVAERKTTLSEKGTIPKIKGVLKAFIAFAGNVDIAMVQPSLINDYKKKMLAEKKAPTTTNDHIVVLTGFFDYCINNKVATITNPARGLLIPGAHNKAKSYKPFTQPELKKIFEPDLYVKKMKLPDFYWGPLVGLFTGARAEEIASLDVEQVYSQNGIWLIDILEGKTLNAVRKVPVHDQLLTLGFVEYVKCIHKAGYKKLFPHLRDGKNGFKKNMCRMFGEYLDLPEVNIVDPLKVFHSFRHTVVTKLTGAGVNEGLKRALVGHDIDTRTSAHDDYIHLNALTIPNLQTAINKLNYDGVDFSKFKLPADAFLAPIARRIKLQAEAEKRAKEKAKADAKVATKGKANASK